MLRATSSALAFAFSVALVAGLGSGPALAQSQDCIDTPEGRVCKIVQEIVAGTVVDPARQRELGLVSISGSGCSGTLVNRFWVLTADHCVSNNGQLNGPAAALTALPITAAWSPLTRTPTRVVRTWGPTGLDVALIFLGAGDFGPVNLQLYFVGDLEAGMTVTKYGRGRFALATAGPPPVAAPPSDGYRSARFTVSTATSRLYTLPATAAGQSGAGGDSGGPDIVTAPDGVGLGIAGVTSTCDVDRVPGKPQNWNWVTNIRSCSSAAISAIRTDIIQIIQEGTDPCRQLSASCEISAVQRHVDGELWRWDGKSACTGAACPGWMRIDMNPQTKEIAATTNRLFQRHDDGTLWMWDATTPCTSTACPGWRLIDRNPRTVAIAAAGETLFQRHVDGKVWTWDGSSICTAAGCPGWSLIDMNPRTVAIAAAGSTLFQRHVDGKLWKWDGRSSCTATACPGWTLIDQNPRTVDMAAAGRTLFQRHVDGLLWRWDGRTPCTGTACPGWMLIDKNPRTAEITGAAETVFQRHVDGRIWKWDGQSPCTSTACPGWTLIDRNPRTAAITAAGGTLFQRHVDGKLWKWDGRSSCTDTACPGWTLIDQNPRTQDIVPFGPIKAN